MLGGQEAGDAVEGVVVDEDRAQQRLLRLDVVRRLAEGQGVVLREEFRGLLVRAHGPKPYRDSAF